MTTTGPIPPAPVAPPPPAADVADAAVVLEGVTKRFRTGRGSTLTAVDDLSLRIGRGEVFGVIGANGAGKSTTMRMLIDILRPTSGTIRVLGEHPTTGGAALRRRIGYLPGELLVQGRSSVGSLLDHLAEISGVADAARQRELCERFGLDRSRQVRQLSKGNKQKLGIVQAFQHSPELLILDEPTSGLDPLLQQEFLGLVREAQQGGATVFLSSHVLSEIEHVADRVAVVAHGRLLALSDVGSLRAGAARLVRARLLTPSLRDGDGDGNGAADPHGSTTPAGPTHADGAGSQDGGDGIRDLERAVAALPGARDVTVAPVPGGQTELRLTLDGSPDALVKLLAQRTTLADLAITQQDLEEAVLSMYQAGPR